MLVKGTDMTKTTLLSVYNYQQQASEINNS